MSEPFLDTTIGEVALFSSIPRARPVGLHKHFHLIAIRSKIAKDTGVYVPPADIWKKLESCWNLQALEERVRFIKMLRWARVDEVCRKLRTTRTNRWRSRLTKTPP